MAGSVKASAFNELVCQQSWQQGVLLRRTRRFLPIVVAVAIASIHYAYQRRDGQAELVKYEVCVPANAHPSQY